MDVPFPSCLDGGLLRQPPPLRDLRRNPTLSEWLLQRLCEALIHLPAYVVAALFIARVEPPIRELRAAT